MLYGLFLCISVKAQITVNAGQSAQILAEKLAGRGVTIMNPVLTCPTHANGIFAATNSNIGLDSGIVLTTGYAATVGTAYGVNGPSSLLASNDDGAPGDAQLEPLAGERTVDACSLEFDVLPVGDTVRFNYVFSSEEYINAVCGPYNDAFAFFISGPGISGTENMALVPGTVIPVTINSINNGVPGKVGNIANCTRMGTGAPFTSYYIDNSAGQTLTHQGMTIPLKAIHAVMPCSTYHLKIIIADSGDPLYDSGVFLEAGSLQSTNFNISGMPSIPSNPSSDFCIKSCLPGIIRVRRTQTIGQLQTLSVTAGGNAIAGFDYQAIPDSIIIPANAASADITINGLTTPLNGPRKLTLYLHSPYGCSGSANIVDSTSIVIFDTLAISVSPADTTVCSNIQLKLFAAGDTIYTYNWSPSTALNNAATQSPTIQTLSSEIYTVTASLPGTSCPAKSKTVAIATKLTPNILLPADTTVCFDASFTLNASINPANPHNSYHWSGPADFTSVLLNPLISNASATSAGTYTITATNDTNGCRDMALIKLNVTIPDTPQAPSPVILCLNSAPSPLQAVGADLQWYYPLTDSASTSPPVPSLSEQANFTYFVTQTLSGCESPRKEIDVEVKKCCDGNIFIPTAFTPNGDGHNDVFRPVEDYGYFIKSMVIVDRWGEIVYSSTGKGEWDGRFKGVRAEVGSYFYIIKLGCILGGTVERIGDVTLLR